MSYGTPLLVNQNPGGLFSILSLLETPGSTFYVSSATGTDAAGYGTTPNSPTATLDYAIGLCTANKGDVIVLLPGHAETTTAIALDVAGVRIVGLGFGASRPTLTSTAAATDLINVTAANCRIENVRLVGAASNCTALIDLSTAADDFACIGCELVQAATPLIGVTINGDRFLFRGCKFRGSADGPDYVFSLETKAHDWVIEDCTFHFPSGLDNGLIKSVAACAGYVVNRIQVVGLDTLFINFSSSSAGPPDGLISNAEVMMSAAVASIEDIVAAATSKGAAFSQVYAVDATGKRAVQVPLVSAS